MRFITFVLCALLVAGFLASCSNFVGTDQSVWSGGLWIIPTLTFLGGVWFLYTAYRASKSGHTQQVPGGIIDSDENVSIFKSGRFYFAVALFIATVVIIILVNGDK